MTITFDKAKTATANNATSLSIPIGITNVAAPAVICAFGDNVSGRTFSGMQLGAVSLSRIAVTSISTDQRLAVGVLSAGSLAGLTATAVFQYGGGLNIGGVVACFAGVVQATPSGASNAVSQTSTATISVNLVSTVGGMLVFCYLDAINTFSISGATVAGHAVFGPRTGMQFLSAAGATTNANAHDAFAGNRLFVTAALTPVAAAAPGVPFIGGLALTGCGLRVKWDLGDLFPPPLIPDPV